MIHDLAVIIIGSALLVFVLTRQSVIRAWERWIYIPGVVIHDDLTSGLPHTARKHRIHGTVQMPWGRHENGDAAWVDFDRHWWPSFYRLTDLNCDRCGCD